MRFLFKTPHKTQSYSLRRRPDSVTMLVFNKLMYVYIYIIIIFTPFLFGGGGPGGSFDRGSADSHDRVFSSKVILLQRLICTWAVPINTAG